MPQRAHRRHRSVMPTTRGHNQPQPRLRGIVLHTSALVERTVRIDNGTEHAARHSSATKGKQHISPVKPQVNKWRPRACGDGPTNAPHADGPPSSAPRPRGWSAVAGGQDLGRRPRGQQRTEHGEHPVRHSVSPTLRVTVVAVVASLLASVLPGRRAARATPVEALAETRPVEPRGPGPGRPRNRAGLARVTAWASRE